MQDSKKKNRNQCLPPRGLCGRADLVELLCKHDLEEAKELGQALGYDWQAPLPKQDILEEGSESNNVTSDREETTEFNFSGESLAAVPFWRAEEYSYLAADKEKESQPPTLKEYKGWTNRPQVPPV